MDPERDEPLLEGLDRLPPEVFDEPGDAPDLFDRILVRTTAVVRRRRRFQSTLALAAAVLIFVAGAATGRLVLLPEPAVSEKPEVRLVDAPRAVAEPLPADPRDLESRLEETRPEDRARVLRDAGDGYLAAENADPGAALYCYRRLLDDAEHAAAASPGENDSWLLLYLKLARTTE